MSFWPERVAAPVSDAQKRPPGRPLKYAGDLATRKRLSKQTAKAKSEALRAENIAVLDMETDPFDNKSADLIHPFTACLYSRNFEPVIIWNEDFECFCHELITVIEKLPGAYTIYAHNGGKFDWMFLIHKLRGQVSFKGRGIMAAKIGAHELRDSFHIIPERLASYHKDEFDYSWMRRDKRQKYKAKIIEYMVSDCKYLLELVESFIAEYGFKLSVGQAAMALIKESLPEDMKPERLSEGRDTYLRHWYFGGRVECIGGRGRFTGHWKMYDVNSMYPAVMANYRHPIGAAYDTRVRGGITDDTVFLRIQCRNHGALVARHPETGQTTTQIKFGVFFVTIHEYRVAMQYGLIDRVKILSIVDSRKQTDFKNFVLPLYGRRATEKELIKDLERKYYALLKTLSEADKSGHTFGQAYYDAVKQALFLKLLLNNAYGKFAQNPRDFKEHYITNPGEAPPDEDGGADDWGGFPAYECASYAIWQRPTKIKYFNNVGTAASITGAARSVLMGAIANAKRPIYCDTDSLICEELSGVEFHSSKLGAWDLEAEYSEVCIAGKKLYAARDMHTGKEKIRTKGTQGVTYKEFNDLLSGGEITKTAPGVTMTKRGQQFYMTRRIRATA